MDEAGKRSATSSGTAIGPARWSRRIRDLIRRRPPRDDRCEINAAIREVIELTRSEAIKNGVWCRRTSSRVYRWFSGDRVELQQVILNLILNAVEAMSEMSEGSRELLITTERATPAPRSSPSAIPGRDWRRVISRTVQRLPHDQAERLGAGTVDLRSIIEARGGRLWASANAPRGAVFQFTLPAQAAETVEKPQQTD